MFAAVGPYSSVAGKPLYVINHCIDIDITPSPCPWCRSHHNHCRVRLFEGIQHCRDCTRQPLSPILVSLLHVYILCELISVVCSASRRRQTRCFLATFAFLARTTLLVLTRRRLTVQASACGRASALGRASRGSTTVATSITAARPLDPCRLLMRSLSLMARG